MCEQAADLSDRTAELFLNFLPVTDSMLNIPDDEDVDHKKSKF